MCFLSGYNLYPAMIVAPIAPIAPAWLTVAIPYKIDPKTITINTNGGIKEKILFCKKLSQKIFRY